MDWRSILVDRALVEGGVAVRWGGGGEDMAGAFNWLPGVCVWGGGNRTPKKS